MTTREDRIAQLEKAGEDLLAVVLSISEDLSGSHETEEDNERGEKLEKAADEFRKIVNQ